MLNKLLSFLLRRKPLALLRAQDAVWIAQQLQQRQQDNELVVVVYQSEDSFFEILSVIGKSFTLWTSGSETAAKAALMSPPVAKVFVLPSKNVNALRSVDSVYKVHVVIADPAIDKSTVLRILKARTGTMSCLYRDAQGTWSGTSRGSPQRCPPGQASRFYQVGD